MEKLRIYFGGLGPGVKEDDLMRTFGSMGKVECVEFNRSKGRSFGYMEFVPASDKALAKLFSAYNGCMWKGGKLKLEKAKEDYLSRLKREWTEDAELAEQLASRKVDADEKKDALPKSKEEQDFEKTQLRIFFPKLRKVNEEETAGLNEKELHIMMSVLNKLLEKEKSSSKVSDKAKFSQEKHFVTPSNDLQVPEDEGGQLSDGDDLLINVVGQSRNQVDPFEDWKPKRNVKQDSISLKMNTGNQKMKPVYDKKRKASTSETDLNDKRGLKRTVKANPHDTMGTSVASNSVPPELGSSQISFDPASVRKSAWKTLLTEKGSASFSISDILPAHNPVESDSRLIAPCSNQKDGQGDGPGKPGVLENVSNSLSRKSSVSGKKSSVGSSRDDQSNKNKELETQPIVEPNTLSGSGRMSDGGAMQNNDQRNKSKDAEMVSVAEPIKLSGSGTGPAGVAGQDDQSGKNKEVEMLSIVEPDGPSQYENRSVGGAAEDDQSNKNKELETLPVPEPNKSSESKKNSGRGSSWLAKSSWLELIGDTNSSPFSISQILPGAASENQSSQQFETNSISGSRYDSESRFGSKDSKFLFGVTSKPHGRAEEALLKKQDHTDMDGNKITSASAKKEEHIDLDGEQKFEQKDALHASVPKSSLVSNKREIPEIVISETCPFMRNAASMKQWAKTKASLSGSLKKKEKGKGKETEED